MKRGVGGDESLESELSCFVGLELLHVPTSTLLRSIFFVIGSLWQGKKHGICGDESLESESSCFVSLKLLYVLTSTLLSCTCFVKGLQQMTT